VHHLEIVQSTRHEVRSKVSKPLPSAHRPVCRRGLLRLGNGLGARTLAGLEIAGYLFRIQLTRRKSMIITNFLIGLLAMLLCLIVQVAVAFWSVRYFVWQSVKAPAARRFLAGIRPLLIAMLIMMLGNLAQIALWAILFVWLGEFGELYEAICHSAVNFTSLGYGDIVMSKNWKLLGPLEAANGVLMLGMTAAALMAILQQLIKAQRDALVPHEQAAFKRDDTDH
jgi:hypothetical protein